MQGCAHGLHPCIVLFWLYTWHLGTCASTKLKVIKSVNMLYSCERAKLSHVHTIVTLRFNCSRRQEGQTCAIPVLTVRCGELAILASGWLTCIHSDVSVRITVKDRGRYLSGTQPPIDLINTDLLWARMCAEWDEPLCNIYGRSSNI